jgi:hypothetical protein
MVLDIKEFHDGLVKPVLSLTLKIPVDGWWAEDDAAHSMKQCPKSFILGRNYLLLDPWKPRSGATLDMRLFRHFLLPTLPCISMSFAVAVVDSACVHSLRI